MPDFDGRLAALRARLAEAGVSGAFLPESADLEWLTGVARAYHESDRAWDRYELVQGCFVTLEAGPLFVLSRGQWAGEAEESVARYEVRRMPMDGHAGEWLRDAARAAGVGDALAVGSWTPFRQLEALREALPDTRLVDAADFVLPLRMRKDEGEIAIIREAGEIVLCGLEAALGRFGTSFGRRDFLDEVAYQTIRAGARAIGYGPDLWAVGPETAIGWMADARGQADAPITAPASISLDLGAIHRGYRSDVGRTIFVGQAPPGQEEALRAVRAAQDAAIAALRPGVAPEEVDAAARALMDEAGFGDAHTIPSGHGIGLELHEPPRFRSGQRDPVPESAVVTVEIAAWRDGETSAFWEDEVVVRATGPERLTSGPKEAYVI